MKKILALLLIVVATFSSCTKEDVDDLRATIERLKAMSGMNQLVSQLKATGWVNEITPLPGDNGYAVDVDRDESTLFFVTTTSKKGIVLIKPAIAPDGKSYWTQFRTESESVNAAKALMAVSEAAPEWITDDNGNKMVNNGNSFAVRINEKKLVWEVSTDSTTWVNTKIIARPNMAGITLVENDVKTFQVKRADGHIATVQRER